MNSAPDVESLRANYKRWIATGSETEARQWLNEHAFGTGVGFDTELEYHLRIYVDEVVPEPHEQQVRKATNGDMRFVLTGRFRSIPPLRRKPKSIWKSLLSMFGQGAQPKQISLGSPIGQDGNDICGVVCAFLNDGNVPSLLSCWHVLVPDLTQTRSDVVLADIPGSPIGKVTQFGTNGNDWALASTNLGVQILPRLNGGAQLDPNPLRATNQQIVTKVSNVAPKTGNVVDPSAQIDVVFPNGITRTFQNQIVIAPSDGLLQFADEGESGTLVVVGTKAVGMLIANNVIPQNPPPSVDPRLMLTAAFPLVDIIGGSRTLIT